MKETVKSYAKVNLMLKVMRKCKNGYHKLDMIMSEIELYDEITFSENENLVVETDRFVCDMEDNICYKIAKHLKKINNIKKGIGINIKKNIPEKAGLGGGSSNGAATLIFLNKYWELGYSDKKLMKIGSKFGCDIPFFIKGDICKVYNYGEKLKKINSTCLLRDIILIVPNQRLTTKDVFKNYCVRRKQYIRKPIPKIIDSHIIENDLEVVANEVMNNELLNIKKITQQIGIKTCVMTGSGSTMVCYLEDQDDILGIQKKLKEKLPESSIIISKLKVYSS